MSACSLGLRYSNTFLASLDQYVTPSVTRKVTEHGLSSLNLDMPLEVDDANWILSPESHHLIPRPQQNLSEIAAFNVFIKLMLIIVRLYGQMVRFLGESDNPPDYNQ